MGIDSVKSNPSPAIPPTAPAAPAAPAAPVQETKPVDAATPAPKTPAERYESPKQKLMSISGRYASPTTTMPERADLKELVAAQRSATAVNNSNALTPTQSKPQAAPVAAPPPETVQASDKKKLDETVKKAETKLAEGPFTKGPDAVEAMNLVKSLPADQQSEAIDRLRKGGNLGNMIDAVPEAQRHELAPLAANAKEPKAKLQLWEASQQGVAAKAIDDKMKTLGNSPADLEKKATLEATKASNKKEIAEEAQFLRNQPGGPDKASLDKMIARKDTELGVEVKYGVNLTNDPVVRTGKVGTGTKVVWEKDELEALDQSLSVTPQEHLGKLKKIERGEANGTKDNAETYPDGRMFIYDNACTRNPPGNGALVRDGFREMATPETIRKVGAQPTFLEWTVQHELGHHVDNHHAPGVGQKYRDAMGNKTETEADAKRLLTPAQLATMKANETTPPPGNATIVGDRGYLWEKGTVYSYDATVYPKGWPGNGEYLAQHYNQANLAPERTAREYLDEPKAKAMMAHEKVKQLKASGGSPAAVADAEKMARAADREVVTWKTTYELMRNDVYGANKATDEAVRRMEAKGATPTQVQAFRDRAYRVSTPEQVAQLEAQGTLGPTKPD